MQRVSLLSACGIALLAAALLIDCGSSNELKSLTITPASANAKNSGNGQVQFTAMGSDGGSSQPTRVNALWWNVPPWTYPPTPAIFSIDSNGVASCFGIITGTFTLWAAAPADQSLPLSKMTHDTRQVTATAQLTCP